jgi:membrane-bound ClpP family serine protease
LNLEKGFLGGFLIMGFALFVTGFLTGMLSIAVLHAPSDFTTLGLITFALGLAVGIFIVVFTIAIIRHRKNQDPEQPRETPEM